MGLPWPAEKAERPKRAWKDDMVSRGKAVRSRQHSRHPTVRFLPLLAAVAALSLGGCMGSGKPALSVQETPEPNLRGAKDIDSAMLERIARAAGQGTAEGMSADAHYRQLAESQPGTAEPRIALGRVLQRQNDLEGAEAAFRDAAKLAPRNADAAIGLAQVLLARQRSPEAVAVLDEALAAAPNDLRTLNAKGVILDKEGRHGEAQALYRRALAVEPKNQMVRNNLGLSLALDGQADAAIAILRPLSREPSASAQYRESLAFALKKKRAGG